MSDKNLKQWLGNSAAIALYREGAELLRRSGIIPILYEVGIPPLIDNGKDVQVMAAQAAWSNGFYSALDYIQNFEDKNKTQDVRDLGPPDYNGIQDAVRRGDLTKEEAKNL